jgi:hypothetical protein
MMMKFIIATMLILFSLMGFSDDGGGKTSGAEMYQKSVTDYNNRQTEEANKVAEYCPSCNAAAATQKDAINKQIVERDNSASEGEKAGKM